MFDAAAGAGEELSMAAEIGEIDRDIRKVGQRKEPLALALPIACSDPPNPRAPGALRTRMDRAPNACGHFADGGCLRPSS